MNPQMKKRIAAYGITTANTEYQPNPDTPTVINTISPITPKTECQMPISLKPLQLKFGF
jgi:hypothetical protein